MPLDGATTGSPCSIARKQAVDAVSAGDAPGARTTRAHAALELGLLLSSHADWADDPRLRGLLTGDAGADCGRDARATRGRRDAALDASLLDALRLAVRLDDAGAPWGEA